MSEALPEIRDAVYRNETVVLDGQFFIDCLFKNCDLQYHGGPVMFLETEVIGCHWHFGEAAHRTINLLQFFGLKLPEFPSDGSIHPN